MHTACTRLPLLSQLDRVKTPWVVVAIHAPFYHTYAGHYKEVECMRQSYEPLFVRHGVDLVLSGHVHAVSEATTGSTGWEGGSSLSSRTMCDRHLGQSALPPQTNFVTGLMSMHNSSWPLLCICVAAVHSVMPGNVITSCHLHVTCSTTCWDSQCCHHSQVPGADWLLAPITHSQ